jgi:dihydroorotate dehydrogenase electron transfer subunit
MKQRSYKVREALRWGPYGRLTLEGEVSPSQPGQFYMLRGNWGADPLLPRPMSILEEDVVAGTVSFLIKVVGDGSRRLAEAHPGDPITGLGPLGNPFPLEVVTSGETAILVGGGVGMPPILNLARHLVSRGANIRILQGARSAEDLLLLEEIGALGLEPVITTEDGSRGVKGLVTAPFAAALEENPVAVFACGPEGMLKALGGLCRGKVPCYLSLEARMGCGYGVCLGCVVGVDEGDGPRYRKVCQDGPVFEAGVLRWE